jgi:hypothetical protein
MLKAFIDNLAARVGAAFLAWVFLAGLFTAYYVDHRVRERKAPVHPYIERTAAVQQGLARERRHSTNRLFILFVDSLRFDYAMNARLMPTLNKLRESGALWGRVKPCLSNMTVHCVEAAFSGLDRSSVLSFAEDFHPTSSADSQVWPHLMAAWGYTLRAACNYVVYRLYADALADVFSVERGQPGADSESLAAKALAYFDQPDTTAAILYLFAPHDVGQMHGTVCPQFLREMTSADDILAQVLEHLKPTDSILVFGDHGMNDRGQHNYAQDVPTFYLYKGPEILDHGRQDISLFSHQFFLNVLFRLPFAPQYQGETYFEHIDPKVAALYGAADELALKRETTAAAFTVTSEDYAVLVLVLLACFLGWHVLAQGPRNRRFLPHLPALLLVPAGVGLGQPWASAALLCVTPVMMMRRVPGFRSVAGLLLLAGLGAKAFLYEPFDDLVHEARLITWFFFYTAYFLAGFFGWRKLFPEHSDPGSRVMAGGVTTAACLILFHYPTVYGFGTLRGMAIALLAVMVGGVWRSRRGGGGVLRFLLAAFLLLFIATQYGVFVENFRVVFFYFFPPEESGWHVQLAAAWTFVAALAVAAYSLGALSSNLRTALALGLIAAGLAVMFQVVAVPGWLQATLSLAAVVLVVLRCFVAVSWLTPFVLFFLLELTMVFVFEFSYPILFQLNGFVAAAGILWLCFGRKAGPHPLLRHGALFLFAVMTLFVTIGFRTLGLDFKFASRWFSEDYVKLWFLIFIITMIKYSLPLLLVSFFRLGEETDNRFAPINLVAAALLVLVPFLAALYVAQPAFTLVVDTLEELIYNLSMMLLMAFATVTVTSLKAARRG